MKKQWILVLIVVFALSGCSMVQVRQRAVSWSESHLKNIEAAREISENLVTGWPFISGKIRAHYGMTYEVDVSVKAQADIYQLDQIAMCGWKPPAPCASGDELNAEAFDLYMSGYALMLNINVTREIAQELIKDVLDFLEEASPGLWRTIVGAVF